MLEYKKGLVPKPISQLFNKNNEYHDYNTRHSSSLHLSVGRGKTIYKSFSFHGVYICNHLKMHYPLMCHIIICFKKLNLSYLTANDIVYRINS